MFQRISTWNWTIWSEVRKSMREILFRGFHPCDGPDTIVVDGEKVKGRWVEGYLYITHTGEYEIGGYCEEYNIERYTYNVLPSTVGQYTNIDARREAWPQPEKHKIFTGDMLGEWGEDENENECVCVLGVVTYWEREGRYVLADENGFCNDWTLEDEAQTENWPNLIHCGTVFDEEAHNAKN